MHVNERVAGTYPDDRIEREVTRIRELAQDGKILLDWTGANERGCGCLECELEVLSGLEQTQDWLCHDVRA